MPSKTSAVKGTQRTRTTRMERQVQSPRPRPRRQVYDAQHREREEQIEEQRAPDVHPEQHIGEAITSGQTIELAQEVKANGVTPHTPCRTRFFAMAMWM